MVRKIGGGKPPGPSETVPVKPSKPVERAKLGGVERVKPTEKQAGAGRVRRATRRMTAAEREHLFKLIQEEADKMFGPDGLPESDRETVEEAVRMTIDASIVEEGH